MTTFPQSVADPLPAPRARVVSRAHLQALRPRQWTKNALVFAGLVFAGRLDSPAGWAAAALAFAVFCCIASAAYLMNDLHDAPADRLHPRKRLRPIASGAVPGRHAYALGALLSVLGAAGALALGPEVAAFALAFAALQVAYTFGLRRLVAADVAAIALLFVIRAAAGAAAVDVRISPWLLACTLLLALFLACAKRRAELALMLAGCTPGRPVLRHYSLPVLTWLIRAEAAAIAAVYAAYALTSVSGRAMVATVPFVVAGLVRYLVLSARGDGEEPERTLLGDGVLQASVAAWLLTAAAVVAL